MKINAYDLETAIHNHVSVSNDISLNNVYLWGSFEADYVKITQAGYIYEYEIKLTKEDFKKDFEKQYHAHTDYPNYKSKICNKHEMIANGDSGLKCFSFVVPEYLVRVDDVPEYAGLYYARQSDRNSFSIKCVKEPKKLNGKKISDSKLKSLLMKVYYKYSDIQYMQRVDRHDKWYEEYRKEAVV